nr:MAG TPA: hypothetical protein [Caudoviricetes sp.]
MLCCSLSFTPPSVSCLYDRTNVHICQYSFYIRLI